MSFAPAAVALLERTPEVLIETRPASGARHRVPIWVVVADDEVFVRSVRGPIARWYRELRAREGALVVGHRRIRVRPQRVRAAATIALVSDGFRRKHRSRSMPASRSSATSGKR